MLVIRFMHPLLRQSEGICIWRMITGKYRQITLYRREVSERTPKELADLIEQDPFNNLRLKCCWGGKVYLEYVEDVSYN